MTEQTEVAQVGDVVRVLCEDFNEAGLLTPVIVNDNRLFAPTTCFPFFRPDGKIKSPQVMSASAVATFLSETNLLELVAHQEYCDLSAFQLTVQFCNDL